MDSVALIAMCPRQVGSRPWLLVLHNSVIHLLLEFLCPLIVGGKYYEDTNWCCLQPCRIVCRPPRFETRFWVYRLAAEWSCRSGVCTWLKPCCLRGHSVSPTVCQTSCQSGGLRVAVIVLQKPWRLSWRRRRMTFPQRFHMPNSSPTCWHLALHSFLVALHRQIRTWT